MTPGDAGRLPSSLEAAQAYTARRWSVIPLPHGTKEPVLTAWQQLRLSASDLSQHFNGKPQNIGILPGEPSNWLCDIDLDHVRAVELAPDYLPATGLVSGRAGKPRSHYWYQCSGSFATKKFRHKALGMVVEFRSTGTQTVVYPSLHPCGDLYVWDEYGEPATVDPGELLECVKRLHEAVLVEKGLKTSAKHSKTKTTPNAESAQTPVDAYERCLRALRRIQHQDKNDGSHRLFLAACNCVNHDLDDAAALRCIREYARERPFRRDWAEAEIIRRLRDAERVATRGDALRSEPDGCVALGARDPETGRLILSPTRTLPTAKAYVQEHATHPEGRTLHCHAGVLLGWQSGAYRELEDGAIRQTLTPWLHDAARYVLDKKTREPILTNFESNPGTVRGALETIKAYTHIDATTPIPSWIDKPHGRPKPAEIVATPSGLIHIPTRTMHAATPAFFSTSAIDYAYDPDAPEPAAWLGLLDDITGDDREQRDTLQEWFGYCLTSDTSLQKMGLIVGPKRSGKGTIARVLTRSVGAANVCGPTTSSLAGPFGLQPLIAKSLAIVSDARFAGEGVTTVTERLLCISGEDALTIDRKHLPSVTMRLPTRFLFLTNELPRLNDASGALANRFIILRLTRSFFGHEDHGLTERLLTELPGILLWALEGWDRLYARGRFVMASSVSDAVQEMEDLASPVSVFVRDRCELAPDYRVPCKSLYEAWVTWSRESGRTYTTTAQLFARDLAAAVPTVRTRQGTDGGRFFTGIELKHSF